MKTERKRKARADWWTDLCDHIRRSTRRVFVLLFIATTLVFVLNHRTEIQVAAAAKFARAASLSSNILRQGAIEHEQQVNEASQ
jgi:hypothetical protein